MLNDGDVGLIVNTGSMSFDAFAVRGDDPAWTAQAPAIMAAGQSGAAVGADAMLTADVLAPIAQAAWQRIGGGDATMPEIVIADLPDGALARTLPDGRVLLDGDAAGQGWFLDPTPFDDGEFLRAGTGFAGARAAAGPEGMDLLSVLMHEFGHVLGLEHGDASPVMSAGLEPGVRLLDAPSPGAGPHQELLFFDIGTGTLVDARLEPVTAGKAASEAAGHASAVRAWIDLLDDQTAPQYRDFGKAVAAIASSMKDGIEDEEGDVTIELVGSPLASSIRSGMPGVARNG